MALLQIYKQTSEKYQACLNIFHSECRIYSREAQMRQTNERKISSLLEYFLQRVQNIFARSANTTNKRAKNIKLA